MSIPPTKLKLGAQLQKQLLIFVIFTVSIICLHEIITNDGLPKIKSLMIWIKDNIDNDSDTLRFSSTCECKKSKSLVIRRHESYSSVYSSDENNQSFTFMYDMANDELERSNFTCDLYNALRRGKSQKVIGFSLYNKNKFYYDKLKAITVQLKKLYPEWIMRVHYDQSINKSIICEIECQRDSTSGALLDNADFCDINNIQMKLDAQASNNSRLNASYIHSMKWRWFPIGDSFVDVFSSRDTDSYLLQREVDSVNVWLNSNKISHIMRGISINLKKKFLV